MIIIGFVKKPSTDRHLNEISVK